MNNFFISPQGTLFVGDPVPGSRPASEEEVLYWNAERDNKIARAEVKEKLAELDAKSIRALHEAILALMAAGAIPAEVANRLSALEEQKEELRKQL